MCGIIGIIGKAEVAPLLMEGLRRLEYRGYDSAGIATLVDGRIERRRAEGKLQNLYDRVTQNPIEGTTGIGHIRWATHGAPIERNAHPIATDRVAIVHNGIIENFAEIKAEMLAQGREFTSDTDTEAVAVLLTSYLEAGASPTEAVAKTLPRLHGIFAMTILFAGYPELLICARRGAPAAIGYGNGKGEMYMGSDALALAMLTQRITYLEEGDWAVLSPTGAQLFDADNRPVERPIKQTALSGAMIGKGNHRHFMHKEIYEQPAVIGDTLSTFVNPATRTVALQDLPFDLAEVSRVTIVACGTSFHSALVAKYWFEKLARISVEVDIASEFRYRAAELPEGGLALFISQSGETADTLAALRYAKSQKQHVAVLVNQPESSMAREADVMLQTLCGPEIGVASTKAFTAQLAVLACFAIAVARARGKIDTQREAELATALAEVPSRIAEVLADEEAIEALGKSLIDARDVLYLGRGTSYPLALEGALKLKELSYIHAEGYAAGEMKHGPIALIDDQMPVIVVAPHDELFEKTASNVQEVLARGGKVIMMSDAAGIAAFPGKTLATIRLPDCDPFVAPILYSIPLQLLAYHTAVHKGTDVDQPRNLAKSVTVE
ncbi:glutamine--fructose-6-phosphate aminotransferase [isomerizing] [Aliidongia dinghuensis]|uniref:Glutamine--fructose-6-phosphate aminotransferase [isomerizing] n=1 Tax=Aliidongia dinghuensis TaxID=1867774 RepID=A0A8J3E5G4_9PROT|nr:glutamine--fructose-6-phosphate transaminase (isomerizing) [Aliidongia dinghuensis]GGF35175.1 glutamine--fructose-6-phosphate aminotransferase [isomerizing] [Aliidongia dinghuensis]